MNLYEAFRALNALNEDTFSVDADGIQKLSEFEQSDDLTDEISIIDPEAESEEDLNDSYVGKVILDCCVCHSKLYKAKEEVTLNDEGLLANVGEECPYCYTPDGFKVIGEVAPFGGSDDVEDNVDVEEEPTVTESLDEGIFDFGKKKQKAEVERKRKEQEAQRKQAEKEQDEENEIQRQSDVIASWKRHDDSDRQAKRDYERSRYNSIKGDRPSNTGYRGVSYSGGDYYSESLEEASAVATRPSIASVLSKNMDSLYAYETPNELRNAIMELVTSSDVDPKEIRKLQTALFSKKSVGALLSTIATYMTGDRVVDTTGKNAENNKAVNESVNNVTIETDDDTVDVAMDGNGGVTVNATPNVAANAGDEVIAPVSDETMTEIEGGNETPEETVEGDEFDVDIDEFDEESFDELGESYFKHIYENVDGYKTNTIKELNNQLIVEGTLKFNSGSLKKTSFVFEALDIDKNGRARFVGDNVQITDGKKAFTVTGSLKGNKFITESLNYNYKDKGVDGKTTRVYGTARVSKRG